MKLRIFTKSGCPRCEKLHKVIERYEAINPGKLEIEDISLDHEDGIAEYCKTCINPNNIPAVFVLDGNGRYVDCKDEDFGSKTRTFPYAGIHGGWSEITYQTFDEFVNGQESEEPTSGMVCENGHCHL